MLRIIGRGAFGEVWIARSLTGSMRAIKVVWREDFEHGGSYEREFEGIKNYEPISRQHPALVDILQVGRNDDRHYYYCIMELADPVGLDPDTDDTGADKPASSSGSQTSELVAVDPDSYEPDILSKRIREHGASTNSAVVRHGAALARGLGYLHDHSLVHRDVKPGNVIFIDGNAKLADVGLVTALGENTFVGTEGFVPPEGPGSASADLFSLGMVLYEMSTGKDRLDFPDLPSVLPEGEERVIWRRVNRSICRACARNPEARYPSGETLALALEGQAVDELPSTAWRRKFVLPIVVGAALVGLALAALRSTTSPDPEGANGHSPALTANAISPTTDRAGAVVAISGTDTNTGEPADEAPDPFRTLEINTIPQGADVYHGEQWMGTTPVFIDPAPSNAVSYNIRLGGHRIEQLDFLGASDERDTIELELVVWRFPQPGMRWRAGDMEFLPSGNRHVSTRPIEAESLVAFARDSGYPIAGSAVAAALPAGQTAYLAKVNGQTARAFCDWMTARDQDKGILLPEQFYRPVASNPDDYPSPDGVILPKATRAGGFSGIFGVEIEHIRYGSVAFESQPTGASVYREGSNIGTTPFELARVRTGQAEYELRMEGYKTSFHAVHIEDGKIASVIANLEQGEAVDFDSPWENSLNMLLLPSDTGVLVSAFEVRRKDFVRFAQASVASAGGWTSEYSELESTNPLHPATGMTRKEAEAFCTWLTKVEQRKGQISTRHIYRLPTDAEWSRLAGLPPEKGRDPAARSGQLAGFFPWGFEWPPPAGSGNFGDTSAAQILGPKGYLDGYSDGYPLTAPVDVVQADPRGLYHVSGNVAEWVEGRFGGSSSELATHGVVRGGSWRSATREELNASFRRATPQNGRFDDIGFRVVLALGD